MGERADDASAHSEEDALRRLDAGTGQEASGYG